MTILLLTASINGVSWSVICLIIALIPLFIAAFVQPNAGGPGWYNRIGFGWAGLFFAVLALALG